MVTAGISLGNVNFYKVWYFSRFAKTYFVNDTNVGANDR